MKLIDPVYLRLVFSGVKSQRIDISNHHAIPDGVTSFFEEILSGEIEVNERFDTIEKFTYLALLQNGLDLNAISILSSINKNEWKIFITKYAKYLNINSLNQLSIFHQRFLVFLFVRSNEKLIQNSIRTILSNINELSNQEWVRENVGYYYFLNTEIKNLFTHLLKNEKFQSYDWWSKDLERLLDSIYLNVDDFGIDFTSLCELLRTSFDYVVQRKGVKVIVMYSKKIDWDSLTDFFHTTRFQYELANEFSKDYNKLPDNWMDILLDEDHPLSYTFSYVWKYIQFGDKQELNQDLVNKLWTQGSPYLRIIVIMIWGYHRLNGRKIKWLDSLMIHDLKWGYLNEEKENWDLCISNKVYGENLDFFNAIKLKLDTRFHYIFDNYWELFYFNDRLNEDVKFLWTKNFSLDIALWIYRHPIWEVGKCANEIIINRLRNKDFRKETIDWLSQTWENEELYALGEVVFELKKINEDDYFWSFADALVTSQSCQLRGSFLSDLLTFMGSYDNRNFEEMIFSRLLPKMVEKASDIWEIQELIRMFKYFLDAGITDPESALEYLHKIELLSHFKDPLAENYNDLWQYAEKIKGFK